MPVIVRVPRPGEEPDHLDQALDVPVAAETLKTVAGATIAGGDPADIAAAAAAIQGG